MLINKIVPKSKILLDVFDGTVVFRQPEKVGYKKGRLPF